MPATEAQKAATRRYNEKHKDDPEFKLKKAEQQRKWKAKHRAEINMKRRKRSAEKRELAKAELLSPPDESFSCYDSEQSTAAAICNQKHKYSFICGEYHSETQNKHAILERFRSDFGRSVFRLKITEYYEFPSETEAAEWSAEHRMKICGSRFSKS